MVELMHSLDTQSSIDDLEEYSMKFKSFDVIAQSRTTFGEIMLCRETNYRSLLILKAPFTEDDLMLLEFEYEVYRFLKEHRRIVKMIEFYRDEDELRDSYLALEYAKGKSLLDYLLFNIRGGKYLSEKWV